MAVASVAATELTGLVASTYTDVDLDSFVTVPSGATGCIILVQNPTATNYASDVRTNGGTDSHSVAHNAGDWFAYAVKLAADHIVEINVSNTGMKAYVRDFFGDESVFNTNGVAKNLASSASWIDIDISADTGADTAIAAYFKAHSVGGSRNVGFRKNGSTDSRVLECDNELAIVGVDASEICEGQINDTDMDFYLMGYCTAQATFDTNATDKSIGTTGAYADADTLDSGKSHGVYEFANGAADVLSWLRKKGATDDLYQAPCFRHSWNVVQGDASRVVEGKISATTADWFRVGQFDAAAGGPTLITASDTLAVGVSDVAAVLAALSAADTVAPGVTDSAALAVVIAASDTLAPGITDAVADMMALLPVADSVAVGLSDTAAAIFATLAAADALDVRIVDAAALLAALTAADTVAPGLADAAAVLVQFGAADTVTVSIGDAALVDILASTLGHMVAIITVRPALAGDVSADAALGAAPGVTPALGGTPTLH